MKFHQYPVSKTTEIEGVEIQVPFGTRYLSIDFTGMVKAWISRPYCYDGRWLHDEESCIVVGQATDGGIDCVEVA